MAQRAADWWMLTVSDIMQPFDVTTYRAALVEWSQMSIGHCRNIHVAVNSYELFSAVSQEVKSCVRLFVDHYWEHLNLADLEALHEQFGEGVYPEEGWSYEDVIKCLNCLIQKRQDELAQGSGNESILGDWYELVECLNSYWENDSYLMIPVENTFPDFIEGWFEREVSRHTYRTERGNPMPISDEEAQLLGRLALLREKPYWWNMAKGLNLARQFIDQFNAMYEFR